MLPSPSHCSRSSTITQLPHVTASSLKATTTTTATTRKPINTLTKIILHFCLLINNFLMFFADHSKFLHAISLSFVLFPLYIFNSLFLITACYLVLPNNVDVCWNRFLCFCSCCFTCRLFHEPVISKLSQTCVVNVIMMTVLSWWAVFVFNPVTPSLISVS